jgi:hypothetical protein
MGVKEELAAYQASMKKLEEQNKQITTAAQTNSEKVKKDEKLLPLLGKIKAAKK